MVHVCQVTLGAAPETIPPVAVETADVCAELVRGLAPGLPVRRLWLPFGVGLLDEDIDAMETATLVILHVALPAQDVSTIPEPHYAEYAVTYRPGVRIRSLPATNMATRGWHRP